MHPIFGQLEAVDFPHLWFFSIGTRGFSLGLRRQALLPSGLCCLMVEFCIHFPPNGGALGAQRWTIIATAQLDASLSKPKHAIMHR